MQIGNSLQKSTFEGIFMEFLYTEEQNNYRRLAREWISENLPDSWRDGRHFPALDDDEDAVFQANWERKLYEAGYGGIYWPKEFGGQGATLFEHFILQEELGRICAPEGINSIGRELVGPILLQAGTLEQKHRYLPPLLNASEIWCQGFSEPNAGSDLASLKTTARQEEGRWIINGQKVWTSFARYASWCLLLARTSTEKRKQDGLTLFILPLKARGITIRPLEQINGRAEFNEVFLDDAEVPLENVIGRLGDGWNIARAVLSVERGINRLYRQARFTSEVFSLLHSVRTMKDRRGHPILDNGRIRVFASFLADLRIMRYRNYAMVRNISEGKNIGEETSTHKLHWSELHQRISEFALDLLQEAGQDAIFETALGQRFMDIYLYARAETIFAGTSQIQRNIISDRILDLPRSI